jgi:predicted phosphodiesterase
MLCVVCGLLGGWLGSQLTGPSTHTTTLGEISVKVEISSPASRGLDLYVPLADWGLRASVFSAPVRVQLEPRRVDRDALVGVVAGDDVTLRRAKAQLGSAIRTEALKTFAGALAGALIGGLLALLVWERRGIRGRRLVLAPVTATAAVAVACLVLGGWSAVSFSGDRLDRPTYYGSGEELESILAQTGQLRKSSQRYRSQVEGAMRAVAALLGGHRSQGGRSGQRILLGSDLHNNALVLDPLRRFGAKHPVVLAGDFTHNGSHLETKLLSGIENVGRPVIAVSGNHDSEALMRDLASRGVTVLTHAGRVGADGRIIGSAIMKLGKLRIAGFEDPLQFEGPSYPSGVRGAMSFTDFDDAKRRYATAVEQAWRWWRALPERPDVLILHEAEIGREIARRVWAADPDARKLTILVGHTHVQRIDRIGPVTVVNGGTVGAGGPFGAGKDEVGLAVLDFDGHKLDSADLVSVDPRDGDAQARRVIVASPDCDRELVFCETTAKPTDFTEVLTAPSP